MARNIDLGDIGGLYEDQMKELVKATTNSWYFELTTREAPNLGTPVDTDVLRQAWQQDITQPFVGRIFNSEIYAEPVMYGTNLPPSWKGKWRTRVGAIKGFPDLLGKEVARKYVPKLLRAITRKI